jgi:hypothetical protein
MKKTLAVLAFTIAVLPFAAGTASAHGCHREPAVNRFGPHRHVGPYCDRIDLPPRPPAYHEREHHHRDQGPPQCVKKCHYVGPFKTCDLICR